MSSRASVDLPDPFAPMTRDPCSVNESDVGERTDPVAAARRDRDAGPFQLDEWHPAVSAVEQAGEGAVHLCGDERHEVVFTTSPSQNGRS